MRAMILAAGRGQRLSPLTNITPKALVEVHGEPIIIHHLKRLESAGIKDIVINLAHLGKNIKRRLGDGRQYGVKIIYSEEPHGGYETGGGIVNALPLLGSTPFISVNADILCHYNFESLPVVTDKLAHLVLVKNPPHNLNGDFYLNRGIVQAEALEPPLTFSGIAIYNPILFDKYVVSRFPITPLIKAQVPRGKISGELYNGAWHDIGTPERLTEARLSPKY
jgi:N-acetyl-alpha-D-muramate 1-phosphate uridylyltransferase